MIHLARHYWPVVSDLDCRSIGRCWVRSVCAARVSVSAKDDPDDFNSFILYFTVQDIYVVPLENRWRYAQKCQYLPECKAELACGQDKGIEVVHAHFIVHKRL